MRTHAADRHPGPLASWRLRATILAKAVLLTAAATDLAQVSASVTTVAPQARGVAASAAAGQETVVAVEGAANQ
eukprot:scaffold281405_cov10-Tisochrysis_lutea.AAC.1